METLTELYQLQVLVHHMSAQSMTVHLSEKQDLQ